MEYKIDCNYRGQHKAILCLSAATTVFSVHFQALSAALLMPRSSTGWRGDATTISRRGERAMRSGLQTCSTYRALTATIMMEKHNKQGTTPSLCSWILKSGFGVACNSATVVAMSVRPSVCRLVARAIHFDKNNDFPGWRLSLHCCFAGAADLTATIYLATTINPSFPSSPHSFDYFAESLAGDKRRRRSDGGR